MDAGPVECGDWDAVLALAVDVEDSEQFPQRDQAMFGDLAVDLSDSRSGLGCPAQVQLAVGVQLDEQRAQESSSAGAVLTVAVELVCNGQRAPGRSGA